MNKKINKDFKKLTDLENIKNIIATQSLGNDKNFIQPSDNNEVSQKKELAIVQKNKLRKLLKDDDVEAIKNLLDDAVLNPYFAAELVKYDKAAYQKEQSLLDSGAALLHFDIKKNEVFDMFEAVGLGIELLTPAHQKIMAKNLIDYGCLKSLKKCIEKGLIVNRKIEDQSGVQAIERSLFVKILNLFSTRQLMNRLLKGYQIEFSTLISDVNNVNDEQIVETSDTLGRLNKEKIGERIDGYRLSDCVQLLSEHNYNFNNSYHSCLPRKPSKEYESQKIIMFISIMPDAFTDDLTAMIDQLTLDLLIDPDFVVTRQLLDLGASLEVCLSSGETQTDQISAHPLYRVMKSANVKQIGNFLLSYYEKDIEKLQLFEREIDKICAHMDQKSNQLMMGEVQLRENCHEFSQKVKILKENCVLRGSLKITNDDTSQKNLTPNPKNFKI